MPAAIEMAHGGGEEEAGGIDAGFGQGLEAGADGEQFAANRACAAIQFRRIEQAADKIRLQQEVRIERQHPICRVAADGLVLGFGKPDIRWIPNDSYAVLEFPQNGGGVILRCVIHHHHGRVYALLRQGGVQAAPDVPAAVVGDDGDAYGGFRH